MPVGRRGRGVVRWLLEVPLWLKLLMLPVLVIGGTALYFYLRVFLDWAGLVSIEGLLGP